MSEEFKNSENIGEEMPKKKPFSVNISEDDFINDIPAPESDVPAEQKPHKVVRYVDNAPKTEAPKKNAKKEKKSFVGEFLAGAAAGAKTVGEGISAGAKAVAEKKPKTEKPVKEAAPKAEKKEKPVKDIKEDETQFPKDEKKKSANGGFMSKLNALPVGAVIGGAAALLVVLVAIILIAATSCAPADDTPSSDGPGNVVIGPSEGENGDEPIEEDPQIEVPTRKDLFAEAFNANNHVMGWLYIPGLEDVDAGVCFSYDKSYPYDKRDIKGNKVPNSYWINGAYYTHFRNLTGDTAADLSLNTVIFGHSDLGLTNLSYANDDPTGPLFSQLFNFKDPSFAEKTPYIYLTLPGEDTVWEVFSVFYNDAKAENKNFTQWYKKNTKNAGSLWYIEPNPEEAEYEAMLEAVQRRSIYDYDVEVTKDDQILTLSTCTVAYGLNARSNYRFVIVAKLVEDPETNHISKNASFTIKEDAPIPDTYKAEFEEYLSSWKPSEEILFTAEDIEYSKTASEDTSSEG
ncbi:MAG: class B sortase [Oscillospiraceae bacterium]|nr:class B sortase [Oscillospiraceae bacterium]